MAKKKSAGEPPKSQAPERASRSGAPRIAPLAHPRLIHGWLVRLGPRPLPSSGVGAAVSGTAKNGVRAAHPRREGPADDATFH
jgi:hypothetical protein